MPTAKSARGSLERLLRPQSIALFGGRWAENVIAQLQRTGYPGAIWPVHPHRQQILGVHCFTDVSQLPTAPDASFIGVNRELSIDIIAALAARGAGGAICFASGFAESDAPVGNQASDPSKHHGKDLQSRLLAAAGDMTLLGPNCYGLLNYLDGVALWPDQHGGQRLTTSNGSGIAIIAQSSNVAISLTMQRRALPIAYMITVGNQAQTDVGTILSTLLDDPRVTVVGLYLEGFGDLGTLRAAADKAHAVGKPVVVLKTGRSAKARAAALSHTASLAGGGRGSSALLQRLGFVEVDALDTFLETLKLLHALGPLHGGALASVSCSGGEAALIADAVHATGANTILQFRDFSQAARDTLQNLLGPLVTIANPLDYHTFIWGDIEKMTACFTAVINDCFDLAIFILDVPRDDRCDPSGWDCAVDAIIAAKAHSDLATRVAVLTTLPENLSEALAEKFLAAGIAPLAGLQVGLAAVDAAIRAGSDTSDTARSVLLAAPAGTAIDAIVLDEASAKTALAAHGLAVPEFATGRSIDELLAQPLPAAPWVLKALGVAHKSDTGAVVLDLHSPHDVRSAAATAVFTNAPQNELLLETMITSSTATVELLIGVRRDDAGYFVLTLAAGGVLTELIDDSTTLLLPASRDQLQDALQNLKISRLLAGFRGASALDQAATLDAILAVCRYAEAEQQRLLELDVNPLIVRIDGAIAVDALIRLTR